MGKGIKLLWYRLAFIVNQKLKKKEDLQDGVS